MACFVGQRLRYNIFPDTLGLTLMWLLPIVFGLHVFEEFAYPGGFGEWSARVHPQTASAMTSAHFYRVNIIGGLAALGVTLGAFDYRGGYSYGGSRMWLVLLGTLAVNAVVHIAGTFQGRRYAPGLVTAVVLYIPLTIGGSWFLLATRAIDPLSALIFVAIGIPAYLALLDRLRRLARHESAAPHDAGN